MTTREAIIAALKGKGWRRGADVLAAVYASGCGGVKGRTPRTAALMQLGRMVRAGEVEKRAIEGWTTANGRQVYAYRLGVGA